MLLLLPSVPLCTRRQLKAASVSDRVTPLASESEFTGPGDDRDSEGDEVLVVMGWTVDQSRESGVQKHSMADIMASMCEPCVRPSLNGQRPKPSASTAPRSLALSRRSVAGPGVAGSGAWVIHFVPNLVCVFGWIGRIPL